MTIKEQRRELTDHLAENPSLKAYLAEAIRKSYDRAQIVAARETGLAEATFPGAFPWTFDQVMDEGFWPEA